MPTSFSTDPRRWLAKQLRDCAYPGYVYGYPHKKAYRSLPFAMDLEQAWQGMGRAHLFGYVHIPWCKQRCSFCNLFTLSTSDRSGVAPYLDALREQMENSATVLPDAHFERLYIGGGTPTYLTTEELSRLVRDLKETLRIDPAATQACIEASPDSLDEEKASALKEMGFQRLSLGVQSFDEKELAAVNRKFEPGTHEKALRLVEGFPQVNLDLIYGLPGQTMESWGESLQRATDSPATSLFLYPLYVRPMTGLGVRPLKSPTTHEMATMYDAALIYLAGKGFRQITMRQFRRDSAEDVGEYRCQNDGMLGLGAGARTYTTWLHYSTPWKMTAKNIRKVIEDFQGDPNQITHGFHLDWDEMRRRRVILSLLHTGAPDEEGFPEEFAALREAGLIEQAGDMQRLTARGLRHADIVGHLFFSEKVRKLVETYEYDS